MKSQTLLERLLHNWDDDVSVAGENGKIRRIASLRNRLPEVVDEHGVRRLYFDRRYVQSAMRLSDPDALELAYTRHMMSFLLLVPEPAHLLLVGLGGGSLAKFCFRHLPKTQITVVESSGEVIAVREQFLVPDDERLRIVHADAAEYLPATDEAFDAILLDGCDADGIAPSLADPAFYRCAFQHLTPQGVLVSNLVGKESSWSKHLRLLWRAFDRKVRITAVPMEGEHYIALAFKAPAHYRLPPEIDATAADLSRRMPLDFRRLASWLRKETSLS